MIEFEILDQVHIGALPPERCASCGFLDATGTDRAPRCTLREREIPAPSASSCASHTALSEEPDPFPIGSFVVEAGGHLAAEAPPRCTTAAGYELIDALGRIEAVDIEQLSFRERQVIMQARDSGERRFTVHLDRLETRMVAPAPNLALGLMGVLPGGPVAAGLLAGELVTENDGRPNTERFTLAGRVLILAAILVGIGAFVGAVEWFDPEELGGLRVVGACAVVLSSALLWLGIVCLERLGIPFHSTGDPARKGHDTPEDPLG